ncbi:methyltransferase domain-containing protein [Microbacterium sp. LRZ72]|uniref:methyltransferase domain-containing protein n=1 Tax=Microbacterium sp. LRZ72 TaxID=2942481 RepID=UPI0029BCD277|nr:methyltransferase domain-containing protein [Microbacterium sp. LRZ72]MDX2377954.1 methyltransferase domain-containing protein [Microbacterium sp. LRZ72]
MSSAGLSRRDHLLRELMDDPNCDPVRLRRTLRRFALVNRLVAGWATVYREYVRPHLATREGVVRILDIGCGAGDVLRDIVARARADGFSATGLGIDPDERCLETARASRPMLGVEYRAAHSSDLIASVERFDIVLSNHVLHHLDESGVRGLLEDSAALTRGLALHSDIHRGRGAYAAYSAGITPLAPGSFLRTDGLRSIRRSFTTVELERIAPPGWRIDRPVAFRLLAVRDASDGH